uniref:DUF11 domain-containing protein n=1 Tax=candidate division CPR3 bacterium TaxID=2268181 RepID=A0A7C4M1A5_UNCC3
MLKKLINSVAVFSLVLALIAPSMTSAAGISVYTTVKNLTAGGSSATEISAKTGEDVLVIAKVSNPTNASTGALAFYGKVPTGLNLVSGSGKLTFVNANGQEQNAPLGDTIVSSNGVMIGEVAPMHYVYVTYRAKVSGSGTLSVSNSIYNGSSVNLNSNSARVNVNGVSTQGTSVATGGISVKSLVSNYTKGQTSFSESVTADRGDELYYRMAITNPTNANVNGLAAYVQIPSGLQYVPGYTKLYYTDANGQDKAAPITDAIVNATGAMIGDLPAMHYEYIVYKVKVAANAPAGTYWTGNQVFNGSGINVSDNTGKIKVDVIDGTNPVETKKLSLKATGYNVTANQSVGYSNSVNAKRGDEIKFKVDLANAGVEKLTNVKITNSLPADMEYVANSMKVVVSGNTVSVSDNKVISLGDLNVGANGYIEFSAKVKKDVAQNTSSLVYSAAGNADGINQVSSIVTINLDAKSTGEKLPDTGVATTVLALILLALFTSVSGYVYLKESNGLKNALKLIKR